MAALPAPQHQTVAAIFAAYERQRDDRPRAHLGASQIGESCARRLWFSFRWAGAEKMPGRVLRLLNTGQREEERLIADLRAIGVRVEDRDADGKQWRVSAHGGHFAGSMDAAAVGFPEAPRAWHVVEFKTSNTKAFKELQKSGVRVAKPMHFAQMQVYMHLTEMTRAAYIVVCKETDDLYFERVEYDQAEAEKLMERAGRIIFAAEPPPGISTDPAFWECKFCPFFEQCFGTAAPAATCRSCAHATAMPDGTWRCELHDKTLSVAEQRAGCDDHRFIPSLLGTFAELLDADDNNVRYRNKLTGVEFVNGERPGYSSAEIAACADKRALGDHEIDALRVEFDGRIVNTRE